MRGLTGGLRFASVIAALCLASTSLPADAEGTVVHTLRRGESVWKVASSHGLAAPELAQFNGIESPRALPVGLRLVLPGERGHASRVALVEALSLLRRARFDEASLAAERGLAALGEPDGPVGSALRAQLELVCASAELAFGREQAAQQRLASALRAEPGLDLEASTTSPKIVELLEATRREDAVEPPP